MQIRRKPEIYFTFASYLIPPQINKSGVHLLQICSLWKNNVCFLKKSKQTCCKSICMHHCFPTFTQTTSKNFRVRFTHVTCANIYFWTKFALLPNNQICECFRYTDSILSDEGWTFETPSFWGDNVNLASRLNNFPTSTPQPTQHQSTLKEN